MAVKAKKTTEIVTTEKWPYGKKNYIIFAAALIVIVIGFILLGQGSETFSVILLLLGYCVLIPAALIMKDKDVEKGEDAVETEESES